MTPEQRGALKAFREAMRGALVARQQLIEGAVDPVAAEVTLERYWEIADREKVRCQHLGLRFEIDRAMKAVERIFGVKRDDGGRE